MIKTLAKIRADTSEIVQSSPCFFNEIELESMGILLNKPFKQKEITYIYQLIGE